LIIALISCVIAGAVHPVSGWFFAGKSNHDFNIYPYSSVDTSIPAIADEVYSGEKYLVGLFLLAIFIFFPFVAQSALFTIIG
jgi:hypothetical protein